MRSSIQSSASCAVQPLVDLLAVELPGQFDVSDGDGERIPQVVRDHASELF